MIEGDYFTCRKRMYWGNLWIGLRRRPCRLRLVLLWLYFRRRNVTNFGFFLIDFSRICIAVVKLLTYRL